MIYVAINNLSIGNKEYRKYDLIDGSKYKEVDISSCIKKKLIVEISKEHVFNVFNDFNTKLNTDFFNLFKLVNIEYYTSIILSLKYGLLGTILVPHIIKYNKAIRVDTRLPYIYSIKSGNGKKACINVITQFAEEFGLKCTTITSLHEEQLIGKKMMVEKTDPTTKKKVMVCIEYEGFFREDILIKDDCLELLNSPKYDTVRAYFIGAWDYIGQNKVVKKLTEQERKHRLEFEPEFVSYMFVQDKPILKKNIDVGLSRKSPILYVNVPDAEESDYKARGTFKENNDMPSSIKNIKNIKNMRWRFSEEAFDYICKESANIKHTLAKKLINSEYSKMMQWTIQDNLLQYIGILTAIYVVNKETPADGSYLVEVEKEHCIIPCEEYKCVVKAIIEHRNNFVVKAEKVKLNKWEVNIVNSLRAKKAFNQDTAITGNTTFFTELAEKLDISVSTINNNVRSLRDKGIVYTRQIGFGAERKGLENSMIWLITPTEKNY